MSDIGYRRQKYLMSRPPMPWGKNTVFLHIRRKLFMRPILRGLFHAVTPFAINQRNDKQFTEFFFT
jgi:hypothetical protein